MHFDLDIENAVANYLRSLSDEDLIALAYIELLFVMWYIKFGMMVTFLSEEEVQSYLMDLEIDEIVIS